MEIKEFLELLSNNSSVSSFEYRMKDTIIAAFSKYADSVNVDTMGNIIAHIKGSSNGAYKIYIAAHLDEIGLMVNKIEENGFLRITSVGGVDPRSVLAQEVIVHGTRELYGIVGTKPPHLQTEEERSKSIKLKDMIIDVGLPKDKVKELVQIGDVVTINRTFTTLLNDRFSGKALDDKSGLAVLLEAMRELSNKKFYADVYFVATTLEEVSLIGGAGTSAYAIEPDIGIAIDVDFGKTPELKDTESIELGKGPGILAGGVVNSSLAKAISKIAKEYNIPNQSVFTTSYSGTDADAINIAKMGVPVGVVSLPLRYMHTSVEVVDLKDIKNAAKLLAFFITSINEKSKEELICF